MMKTLRVSDVAQVLGLHANTVYRLVEHGDLPGVKIGGIWHVSEDRLRRVLDPEPPKKPKAAASARRERRHV